MLWNCYYYFLFWLSETILFTFPFQRMVEKVFFFQSNFRSGDFDGFTQFDSSCIQKSFCIIFQLLIYVCVCVCVYYQHNSITTSRRNSKFGIVRLYHMQVLLRVFMENGLFEYRDTQKNSNTLRPMDGIFCLCILVYLDYPKCIEINVHFDTQKNM